jgi:hypoxanthine phosphoribosyltransferase
MAKRPYDYSTRKGVWPISWEDFHGLCKALAKAVSAFQPEVILPIGRGGYYPGTLLAHLLQVEVYPVRVSRRVNNQVKYDNPRWLVEPPALVDGKRVLIVDEICGIGETISMVKERVKSLGAREVRSAVLYAHTWGTNVPDYVGLVSDALLLNPWDREVLIDGAFQMEHEYVEALTQQGIAPDPSLLIKATSFELAKSTPVRQGDDEL